MKIEKIKKNKSGKYTLKLDNNESIVTYDDVILKNKLLYNKEIDSDILENLYKDTYYYDIYNKVIKLISTRLRSVHEIKEYLDKNNLKEEDKNKIINKLLEIGLLNDLVFAKAYASDKLYLSNCGPNKIYNELKEHQIDDDIINEVIYTLSEDDIKEKLIKLISKKIKNNHKYSNYLLKQKVINELYCNGFDKNMIISIYESLEVSDNSNLEREYNKLYSKYSKKFEGYELFKKIKEKLYQKGFDINEINNFINEKNNE